MANFRCELCDGRIVNNRCQDCGMDYSRRQKRYDLNTTRTTNETEAAKKKEQTNRKTEQSHSQAQSRQNQNQRKKVKTSYQKQRRYYSKNFGREKRRSKFGAVAAVVIIILAVLGVFQSIFTEQKERETWNDSAGEDLSFFEADTNVLDEIEDYNYTPYEDEYTYDYSEEEEQEPVMPEEGEEFSVELTPGRYVGGQQIPAGTYKISLISNSDDLVGTVQVEDEKNNIYESEFMASDAEYGVSAVEGLQIFEGGVVSVSTGLKVLAETENAQMDTMEEGTANPLTESFDLKFGETLKVGTDIPAGVYDVEAVSGVGTLEITGKEDMYEYYNAVVLAGPGLGPEYSEGYCNLFLEEGRIVAAADYSMEDFQVRMVPSERVYGTINSDDI
ncbi:MAG: hypothetical protein ACOX8H_01760 [Ruminococcus sp.]|jgi:hypothetical protein